MPLIFTLFVSVLGFSAAVGWRAAMALAGALCLVTGVADYFVTQDTPEGNFSDLRREGKFAVPEKSASTFWIACRDRRVWALFVVYGCCFGMELTLDNIAALYFTDYFQLDLQSAGLAAAAFGMMNLFARALGGIVSDRCASNWGLRGRVWWLFLALLSEGVLLIGFSQANQVGIAIASLLLVGLFVKMSNGATYAIVPFVNKQALGSIAGIVGAGGNAGAVAAGFLFKGAIPWPVALLILGCTVTCCSMAALCVTFSPETEAEAEQAFAAVGRHSPAQLVAVTE
jgi:NNP family nitrate/nitrite transporter-like MFS transporter